MTQVPFADDPKPTTLFGMPYYSPAGFPEDQIAFVGQDGKVKGRITGLTPTGRFKPADPEPYYSVTGRVRHDIPNGMFEVKSEDLYADIAASAKTTRHNAKSAVYKILYGAYQTPEELGIDPEVYDRIRAKLLEFTERYGTPTGTYTMQGEGRPDKMVSVDYASLEARILAAGAEMQKLDERMVEALLAAGLQVRVSPGHKGAPIAIMPDRYQPAYDAVMRRARKVPPERGYLMRNITS